MAFRRNKWVLGALFAIVALILIGSFVGFAEGKGVLPSGLDKAVAIVKAALSLDYSNQLARGAGECDRSATTTDCSKVPQGGSVLTDPSDWKPGVAYGALKNTYADSKYGFSIKYPDELELVNGGDLQLVDSRNEKAFSLKICTPESPCGKDLSDALVTSVAALQKSYVTRRYTDGGSQYTESFQPVASSMLQTNSGVSVLKQSYRIVIRDSSGTDVTERECEMCAGQRERYVAFRSPTSYLIVQVTGLNNDKSLELAIIRSITY